DVDEATDRVIAGPAKKSRVMSEKERRIVAYHEAGHTVIGMVLDEAETVHKVTIVPRGQAGGYAVMLPKEDRYFMTKPELLDRIVGLLGGRVAEEVTFGEASTGAHNDFQRTTSLARSMVMEYGMSDKLGPIQFGESNGQVFLGKEMGSEPNYSDKFAYEIDLEVQKIVKDSYDRCTRILTEHQEQLNLIAETLLVEETLDREQIEGLFHNGKLPERVYDDSHLEEEKQQDLDHVGSSYKEIKDKLSHDEDVSEDESPSEEPDMTSDDNFIEEQQEPYNRVDDDKENK